MDSNLTTNIETVITGLLTYFFNASAGFTGGASSV